MLAQGKPLRRSSTLKNWKYVNTYHSQRVRAPFWRACQRVAQGPIHRCFRLVPWNRRQKGSRKESASAQAETLTVDCFPFSLRADAITQHPCQSMGEFPCLGDSPCDWWKVSECPSLRFPDSPSLRVSNSPFLRVSDSTFLQVDNSTFPLFYYSKSRKFHL